MLTFTQWLENTGSTLGTENVDERQIDSIYDKAHLAVQLVQLYDQTLPKKLLKNISTVANLPSGAYGLYNSSENSKVVNQRASGEIRFKFGQQYMDQHRLGNLPAAVIRTYLPDVHPNEIQPSDVIHVNVARILREFGDSLEAVIQIAATIVHECTHELEREERGTTNETGPMAAEKRFVHWFHLNTDSITKRLPQLASLRR